MDIWYFAFIVYAIILFIILHFREAPDIEFMYYPIFFYPLYIISLSVITFAISFTIKMIASKSTTPP